MMKLARTSLTEAEQEQLVDNALNNMVRVKGGQFNMGAGLDRLGEDWYFITGSDGTTRILRYETRYNALIEHPVRLSTFYKSRFIRLDGG